MNLPFTPEGFFEVFIRYNQSVWPTQLILHAIGLLCAVTLLRTNATADRIRSMVLALLWAWMGIVYHLVFFARINPAAWLFGALFLAGSASFLWFGVLTNQLRFRAVGGVRGIPGWTLVVFSLALYPAIGYALGHRYPAVPTFGLPCPTTIFTLGLLLFAEPPVPRAVFIVPVLWAAVGSLAAFWFGVYEDLALMVAGVAGLFAAVFWHRPANRALRASRP